MANNNTDEPVYHVRDKYGVRKYLRSTDEPAQKWRQTEKIKKEEEELEQRRLEEWFEGDEIKPKKQDLINALKKIERIGISSNTKRVGNWAGIPDEELPNPDWDEGEPDWWRDMRLAQEYEVLLREAMERKMFESGEGGTERIPSMKLEPGMDYNMRTFEPFTFESGGIFTETNKRKRRRPAGSI
jgi:hypothetical protein